MYEEMSPSPEDPYGIAKFAVEQDLRTSRRIFGLPHVIFRPHNVYGPGQNIGDRFRNVVGIFINCIMQGRPLPICGSGVQVRAFTEISDVAPYIACSPTVRGAINEVFNIGSDEFCTINTLSHLVCDAMGGPYQVEHHEARQEVLNAFSLHDKFLQVFNSKPTVPLTEGLRRMADWARTIGPRTTKPFRNIEITRRLPETCRSERQRATCVVHQAAGVAISPTVRHVEPVARGEKAAQSATPQD
jgi:UDP-glucose 4-epimerase